MINKPHAAAVEAAKRMPGCFEMDDEAAALTITAAYAPLVQAVQRVLRECGLSHPLALRLQNELLKVVGDD